jgi:hypothetical protein
MYTLLVLSLMALIVVVGVDARRKRRIFLRGQK